jgi:hypothetical protein
VEVPHTTARPASLGAVRLGQKKERPRLLGSTALGAGGGPGGARTARRLAGRHSGRLRGLVLTR